MPVPSGRYRDGVIRRVTDVPVVGHPLRLNIKVTDCRCVSIECDREVFAHNTDRLARRGASTTRRCARGICRRLMIVPTDTTRLDAGRILDVDEHRCTHTRRRVDNGYVAVIVDLTLVLDGTGPARHWTG